MRNYKEGCYMANRKIIVNQTGSKESVQTEKGVKEYYVVQGTIGKEIKEILDELNTVQTKAERKSFVFILSPFMLLYNPLPKKKKRC